NSSHHLKEDGGLLANLVQCYKKIPKGEEVAKSGSNYFRKSWYSGYGTEIYCKKCAIEKDGFDRISQWIEYSFPKQVVG
ncbi:29854_t:CDS:2, partial [Racocetra persica]